MEAIDHMTTRRGAAALAGAIVVAASIALAAGCGSGGSGGRHAPSIVVALDFTPNPVHAPIFTAVREGDDLRHGIRIRIQTPGSQPDSLKLLSAGRADVGILDIQDLGLARLKGADIVAIGALVQRPLAALVAQPQIRSPRDLAGKTVGVSGLPSDPAFLRAIVGHVGGDYRAIRQVTIGFAAVSALLTKRVAAVPAFWNVEGVILRRKGLPVKEFRIDDYGAPKFPEVVLMVRRSTLEHRRGDLVRFLAAVRDGLRSTLAHRDAAARQIARAAGTPDVALERAELDAVAPAMLPPLRLDRRVLEQWADFDVRTGLLPRRPNVDRAFDFALANG